MKLIFKIFWVAIGIGAIYSACVIGYFLASITAGGLLR